MSYLRCYPSGVTLEHGASYTVTGSGFGAKPASAPLLWEDFADTTLDSHVYQGSNNNVTLSTASPRTAHALYTARGNYSSQVTTHGHLSCRMANALDAGTLMSGRTCLGIGTSETWFAGYWIRFGANWTWPRAGARRANMKFARYSPDNSASLPIVSSVVHTYSPTIDDTRRIIDYQPSGSETVDVAEVISLWTVDTWHHIQTAYQNASAQDATDGRFRIWLDGALLYTSDAEDNCHGAFAPKTYTQLGLMDSWPTLGSDTDPTIYADCADFYVDTTWARLELGDRGDDYDLCTHREMQIPTDWANDGTSIVFTANAGSFTAGQTAYLWVTTTDGTHLMAQPVTVG